MNDGHWVSPAKVGCLAIVAETDGKTTCPVMLHCNPHPALTARILTVCRLSYGPAVKLSVFELERCEHCALGSRDITGRPVAVIEDANLN